MNQQSFSSLIWSVADRLRADFKQSEYGKVILLGPAQLYEMLRAKAAGGGAQAGV